MVRRNAYCMTTYFPPDIDMWHASWHAGSWLNIKMPSSRYRNSHCRDKTILRPSYLYNGFPILVRLQLHIEPGPLSLRRWHDLRIVWRKDAWKYIIEWIYHYPSCLGIYSQYVGYFCVYICHTGLLNAVLPSMENCTYCNWSHLFNFFTEV